MSLALGKFARFLSRHPKSILVFSILLTIFSIWLASHLQIKSSLTELLPQDTEHVRNLDEISKRAGGVGYLIVALEHGKPETMEQFADDLNERIKDNSHIRFIYHKNDLDFIKRHALLFLSVKDLEKAEEFISEKVEKERSKLNPFLINLLEEEEEPEQSFAQFDSLLDKYAIFSREYLTNNEKDLLVMLIKPREVAANIPATKELVTFIDSEIRKLRTEKYADATFKISMSGRYISQLQQNQSISRDLKSTAIISAVLIFLSLSIFFRKRRTFFVIGIPLIMGVAWTFGITYLIIGELNLITTFLVAILIGLGINFGIHFFKRYLEFRETKSPEESIELMYTSSAGVSSITASLTTAAAFFSLMLTQFKGFNQFGIIAGTGSLVTLVAYFLTFPSIIILYERFYPVKDTKTRLFPRLYFAEKLIRKPSRLRISFYALTFIGIILVAFSFRIKFEYDFNKLGTFQREDFRLKERINNLFNTSLSPTIVMVNSPEQSQRTVEVIRKYIKEKSQTIATVQDLNSIVPTQQDEKIEIINRIKDLTKDKLFTFLEGKEKEIYDRFKDYLNVEKITVDMLPSYLTVNFKGMLNPSDRFVLIYPSIELGNGKDVMQFSHELDEIRVDGEPLRTCSESLILADILQLITRDGAIAIIVTFITLLIILWLHFKSIRTMFLVTLPILLGTIALLGVMGAFGIKSNFINIVAFPIILGIGIDNSVHFFHRYKEDHSLWFAFYHTGMAMFLTTLTTTIGFGSLFFAQHKGLQSLGVVAVIGLVLNLLTTFIILPILIKINKEHSFRILGFTYKDDQD